MSDTVGVPDLLAMCDVADDLVNLADSLSAEQAIELLEAATKAAASLGVAITMLKSRAVSTMEQPILIGDAAWSKKPTMKDRPDHRLIHRLVVENALDAACDRETGDRDPRVAVEHAVGAMEALFVSPSTLPKKGGVQSLGLAYTEVVTEEHTGYELKKVIL